MPYFCSNKGYILDEVTHEECQRVFKLECGRCRAIHRQYRCGSSYIETSMVEYCDICDDRFKCWVER